MNRSVGWFASIGAGSLLAAAVTLSLCATDAGAKTTFGSPYTLEQNYSSSLRMIRVDMGLKITEKDPESAYIMFEYKSSESGNKVTSGSIEMVPQSDNVQVIVQLPQMPQYHEEVMMNSLKKKLQSDYGDPPKKASSKKKDAGAPADGGQEAN